MESMCSLSGRTVGKAEYTGKDTVGWVDQWISGWRVKKFFSDCF